MMANERIEIDRSIANPPYNSGEEVLKRFRLLEIRTQDAMNSASFEVERHHDDNGQTNRKDLNSKRHLNKG